jgi:hypothetical protein
MPVNTVRPAQLCAALLLAVGPASSTPSFTTIDAPGNSGYTEAYGINSDGEIVGAYGNLSHSILHGFLLRRGVFTTIDVPGSSTTEARG